MDETVDEQRELADELAGRNGNRGPARQLDVYRALGDHEQPRALLARLHQHVPRRERHLGRELGDVPQADLVEAENMGIVRSDSARSEIDVGHGARA